MKVIFIKLFTLVLVITCLSLGCDRAKKTAEKEPLKIITEEFEAEKMAGELWNKIQNEKYWVNWKMWPDKAALYKGKEPHGALLTTYVNDAALKTIINNKGQMPPEAIIIQENYTADKTLDFITLMYKKEGFNPKVNNWFWVKFGSDGKIATAEKYGKTMKLAGKVATCIECHGEQSTNDYLFTSPLREEGFELKKIEKESRDAEKVAAELWNKIQSENYRANWKTWPGKELFYEGKEPHGALLSTYVNIPAHEAIVKIQGKMPPGAIIIKENYAPDKNIISITIMYKIEGFNPEAFDWFWIRFSPNGKVMTEEKDGKTIRLVGKVAECIECHGKQTSNDYIFTNPLKILHNY